MEGLMSRWLDTRGRKSMDEVKGGWVLKQGADEQMNGHVGK